MATIGPPANSIFSQLHADPHAERVAPRDDPDKRTLHHEQVDRVELHARSGGTARAAEADKVRAALLRYLRTLGTGASFQALDFTAWLTRQGAMPDPSVFDARGIGGLFVSLRRSGVIEQRGYKANGGCPERNINSAMRPSYVVRSLDFTPLGWEAAL